MAFAQPGFGVVVKGPAQSDALREADQFVDEAFGDGFLHHQPCPGGADLPGVDEGSIQGVVDGGVEVRVREHHVGVLSAKLQR